MRDQDCTLELQNRVQSALNGEAPRALDISGGASRMEFNLPRAEQSVMLADHCGVIDYQPDELMLRVRSGTPLVEIDALLHEHGQRLAANIPRPASHSTIGGAVATGWDGPERAFGLSLRDSLLGCRLVNGRGQVVNFGGQVMKNVAGYDVSRLQVGALGTLGVLLDLSLRLLPAPETSASRSFAVSADELPQWWQKTRALRPLLRACCVYRGRLHLFLSGRETALRAAVAELGGEESDLDWSAVRDLRHEFFQASSLAAVYLPRFSQLELTRGASMIDWEGARIWVGDGDHAELYRAAQKAGGFVRVLRGEPVAVDDSAAEWHRRIKGAFDPAGIFNRALFAEYFATGEPALCR